MTMPARHCERSEAIQGVTPFWIASPFGFAMTSPPVIASGAKQSRALRPSGLLRRSAPRNDDARPSLRAGCPSLRAERGNPGRYAPSGLLHPSGSQ
ncbi:MAG: hypothetical protein LBT00_01385 [Spirochaetaceae bacterium]|nr:hypothetical protein [Spirochaetaceae bacterium]